MSLTLHAPNYHKLVLAFRTFLFICRYEVMRSDVLTLGYIKRDRRSLSAKERNVRSVKCLNERLISNALTTMLTKVDMDEAWLNKIR